MTPIFTVITIVYNDIAGLERTGQSVLSQTEKDYEWIVVDGGSTDGTVPYLHSSEFPGRFISEADEGISDAWNKGISLARGEYILILNAGDTISPDLLFEYRIRLSPKKILCAHSSVLSEDGDHIGIFRARPKSLWRGMTIPHLSCLVPKGLYEELGSYSHLPFSMDYDWFLRCYKSFGNDIFEVVDINLCQFYLGGTSSKGYVNSFRYNQEIMIKYGMNRILARILTRLMIAKHSLAKDGF